MPAKKLAEGTYESGKWVVKGTKNTAVFVDKVGRGLTTEVIHHSAGAGRFVVRTALKGGKILLKGLFRS